MNQVWLAFITGLTTGGISCFAVQGGLLASSLGHQKDSNPKLAVSTFLVSKIIAYTILGALLGAIGATLFISPRVQGFLQILAGVFMLLTVGRLLDIHPIFRRFVITPPKAAYRFLRSKSINEGVFSLAILGFLTVLIPCGVTQAMMLLAVSSGNAVSGALTLAAFTLGTTPTFFALGVASSQILKRPALKYLASAAIFILAILAINTGQVLRGSPHTLQNYWIVLTTASGDGSESIGRVASVSKSGKQEVEIKVSSRGYQSNVQTLKAGTPVSLKLTTQDTQGCLRAFTIPELNINKVLPVSGEEIVEFTPNKKGRLAYTCSMGMYSGYFEVI